MEIEVKVKAYGVYNYQPYEGVLDASPSRIQQIYMNTPIVPILDYLEAQHIPMDLDGNPRRDWVSARVVGVLETPHGNFIKVEVFNYYDEQEKRVETYYINFVETMFDS